MLSSLVESALAPPAHVDAPPLAAPPAINPDTATRTRLLEALAAPLDLGSSSLAVPGRRTQHQSPARDESPRDLLRDVDTAPSAWRRSEALLRLLTGPRVGVVGGVELDLQREAAVRIGLALGADDEGRPAPERGDDASDWLRFETLALHRGAARAQRDECEDPERRVRAAWLLGDRIGRVMREGAFRGVDPGRLAARLDAALPEQPTADPDALWPARMGAELGSLRLDEVWLLHALFLARERWEPPGAVLDALRRLAGRLINDAEQSAEEALEAGHDVLGWPGTHLAPPLAARWLLHAWRARWLARLPSEAQTETIAWLERWQERGRADRGAWVMLALYREASDLGPVRDRARDLWTKLLTTSGDVAKALGNALGPFCLWGST